jgi:flagellar assembly protein FliH
LANQRPKTKDQRPKTKDQRPKTKDQRPKTKDQRPKTKDAEIIMSKPFSTDAKNIKHWLPPEVSGRVVGANESQVMRPQTVEDIEAVYEEGRKKGYQAGFAQARAEIDKISKILHFLQQPLRDLDEEVEQQFTELAMTIARLLLKKECATDARHIQQLVHDSLAFLPLQSRNIRVHFSPVDIQLMQQAGVDPYAQEWTCVENNSITQGGCKVESDQSQIDASVETRVQQLVDQLTEHLPQTGNGDN